jgi:hypothetical protein
VAEPAVVRLLTKELVTVEWTSNWKYDLGALRTGNSRQKCDLAVVEGSDIREFEVNMARFRGDNGKPADETLMHLLSLDEQDRNALTDCQNCPDHIPRATWRPHLWLRLRRLTARSGD